ncbi:MAG: NAD-dependent deacylase [Bacteroidales bacterium]|nr:NAD-dependent deacylase [Bacteroidales bacterium]MDT8374803.1 NAD-dependent deacylase [Bacteroidales bacterium]
MPKKIVVLSGAGMSAESGIKTFRDSGGLWEQYRVEEVASIEGWYRNPDLVQRFYNERRRQLEGAKPNAGHRGLAELEKDYDVHIITQNVDNLHERSGSTKVLHLHGQLTQARSSSNPALISDIGYRDIAPGEKASDGTPLRPNIVWFGEAVPAMTEAADLASHADIFAVIGTSLNVYPAAGLIHYVPITTPVFIIDPKPVPVYTHHKIDTIAEGAGRGVEIMTKKLAAIA